MSLYYNHSMLEQLGDEFRAKINTYALKIMHLL
jgi:hypothetical protein